MAVVADAVEAMSRQTDLALTVGLASAPQLPLLRILVEKR
jgi:hypothetical protein